MSKLELYAALVCDELLGAKTALKMTISTSVWGAQHTNAGPNIQHVPHGKNQSSYLTRPMFV